MGKILLTGGCGFIGSHTAVELINEGYEIVIADDLSNSSRDTVDKIETITGKRPLFYEIDVADAAALTALFAEQPIDAVIHFAGFKAVGESVEKPLAYYRNNLDSTLTLLETMSRYGTKCFVFSSSATVYGDAEPPFSEEMNAKSIEVSKRLPELYKELAKKQNAGYLDLDGAIRFSEIDSEHLRPFDTYRVAGMLADLIREQE